MVCIINNKSIKSACTRKTFVIFVVDLGRYPFDWKTPFGYSVAIFSQCFGVTIGILNYVQFLNFVYESCWIFITIARDLIKELVAFNTDVHASNGNSDKLTKCLVELVQMLSEAKE